MNEKSLQMFGLAASAVGMAATIASNWIANKELKLNIENEVSKQMAEAIKNLNK